MNRQKPASLSLTQNQKQAIRELDTNILVSAGAGTGKTRVLVERILHILKNNKAGISELLVLTFTDKAANEIKVRLSERLRDMGLERARRELEQAAIGTFHGFATRLLKEHPVESGVDPDFRVIENERADLLKDEIVTTVLETSFQESDEAFQLVRYLGETAVRSAILKLFATARHEGKMFSVFFEENDLKRNALLERAEKEILRECERLIPKLSGELDETAWSRFVKNQQWDWNTLSDFREWKGSYSSKRKEGWKEWRVLADELAALRMEPLAVPWRAHLENLALRFETAYESQKQEENGLDFDDLQIRAVNLFLDPRPAMRKIRDRYQQRFKFILVDEFQDTNYLQTRFVDLLSSGSNVFVVGDFKQSIYGFRGAEPGIFLARETQSREDPGWIRVPLTENFRSRAALLKTLNEIFRELWDEDQFPFEALSARAEPDPRHEGQVPVEILVTHLDPGEEKAHARIREALAIAGRLKDLHEKEGVPYGDMALLFRGMTMSGIYEYAMKVFDIPYFIVAGRGFYAQPEIRDLANFLTHLEKPLLDIPLAASLRSPLFHVTDSTLFWLSRWAKTGDERNPLAEALKEKRYEKIPEISQEQKKSLAEFSALADELRGLKDRISLAELIDKTLERTGYELSILATPGGARRYANVKKLMAMVREHESFDRMPLARFLVMMERLEVQEVRESEAQISAEGEESVRMMTIHGAKGLEFPVVVVADLGARGGGQESKAVVAHANEGYALRLMNGVTRAAEEPFSYRKLDEKITAREREERKRLFYVACTRAKSRLFLSGVHEVRKNPKNRYGDMLTWMDWVMTIGEKLGIPKASDHDRTPGFVKKNADNFREQMERTLKELVPAEGEPLPEKTGLVTTILKSVDLPVSAYVLFVKDPLAFWRAYQIGWKTTGGDVEGRVPSGTDDEESVALDFPPSPDPRDFGTAMHAFLECFDIRHPEKYLEEEALDRFFKRLGGEAVPKARNILKKFFSTPLFRKLQAARKVEREIDFVLNERRGLIHGKLDILFQDAEGAWHVLDFKTAEGDAATARTSGYDLQIELYALAVHRILGFTVRSGIIYYLENSSAVTLDFSGQGGGLEKTREKITGLQETILDFCNQKMGAGKV